MEQAGRAGGLRRPARPRMKDVAQRAGVSIKTVSRVFAGEARVSAEVVERVRAIADEIGYRPDLTASSLRRADGRTSSIALLVDDLANPFFATLQRAVEDVATEHGVLVFAASVDDDVTRLRRLVNAFAMRRADGLVVAPIGEDHSFLAAEVDAGTPVVFVDRPPYGFAGDVVLVDNHAGAADAVRHLAAYGHRRIAYLGDRSGLWTAAQRYAGFGDAVRELDLVVDPGLVRRDLAGADAAARATGELLALAEPPTAMFAAQNLVAMGVIRALHTAGRARDVALVGFDDFPMAAQLDPAVTVVWQDPARIGTEAARVVFARLDGDTGPPRRILLSTSLVERGSGEIRAPR